MESPKIYVNFAFLGRIGSNGMDLRQTHLPTSNHGFPRTCSGGIKADFGRHMGADLKACGQIACTRARSGYIARLATLKAGTHSSPDAAWRGGRAVEGARLESV